MDVCPACGAPVASPGLCDPCDLDAHGVCLHGYEECPECDGEVDTSPPQRGLP